LDVFYQIDRTGSSLQSGQVLDLMDFTLEGSTADEGGLKERFPEGVTRFGLDIIHSRLEPAALERERKLEAVRVDCYPHRPSRCVAVFGCKQIEDMNGVRGQFFRFGHAGPRGRIWKIEGRSLFEADMNVFIDHFNDITAAAHAYWSQEKSAIPLIEFLIKPPVTVLEEIPD